MDTVFKRQTLSKIAFACLLALIFAVLSLYLYNIIEWANLPDYGFGYRTAAGVSVVGVVTEPGRTAGIGMEVGDRILKVNGKSFTSMKEFRAGQNKELGEKNSYLIERRGKGFEVTITNTPLGVKGAFIRSGLTYLLDLCYVFIGILVFLMKPHQRTCWIFFLFGTTFGLLFVFFVKLGEMIPGWLGTIHILINTLWPAAFIHLALVFPEERRLLKKYPYVQLLPYFASTFLFIAIRQATTSLADAPRILEHVLVAYCAASVLIFLGSCFQSWFTSSSEIAKLRSKMILLGVAISASIPLFETVANPLLRVYIVPNFNYYLPFLVAFPAFIGYSIVKHNLFDIDAIIKRTYGYIVTTAAISGIYILVLAHI